MAREQTGTRGAGDQAGVVAPEYVESAAPASTHQPQREIFAAELVDSHISGGQSEISPQLQDAAKRIERISNFVESEGYALRHGIEGIPERPIGDNTEIGLEEAMHRYRDTVTAQSQATPRNAQEREQAQGLVNGLRLQFNADAAAIERVTAQKLPKAITENEVQISLTGPKQKVERPKQAYTREDLIRQLRAFTDKKAEEQKEGGYKYIPAEAAIGANLANQLEAGAKTIDLDQRYATDDPAKAQERHQKALENLAPMFREVEKQGHTLKYGHGIAHGKGEVLAVQQLNRGLVNAQALLQKAAHSHNNHAPAPRISISNGGI